MRKKEKIIGAVIIAVIAAVFVSIGYVNSSSEKISQKDMDAMFVDDDKAATKKKNTLSDKGSASYVKTNENYVDRNNDAVLINVEIKGEVKKPNVYKMNTGSIVNDLIEKSGGAKEDADMSSINRAAKLNDNQCIVIPKKGEKNDNILNSTINSINPESNGSSVSEVININTADKERLKKLSGIGEGRAQKIIDYRTEHGQFKSVDDIKNVSGIGDSIFNNIKNKITVK